MLNKKYSCETLREIPGAKSDILYYPGAIKSGGRDGLIVQVKPGTYDAWLGMFAFGDYSLSDCFSCPSETQLCVVAKGTGYFVNVEQPDDWFEVPVYPILAVFQSPEKNLLVFNNFTDVFAWSGEKFAWQTQRLASDDLKICEITNNKLLGTAIRFGKPIEFEIDIESGLSSVSESSSN